MKATPRIAADLEEYPELRVLAQAALQSVVGLMQIHDIVELRRIRKSGVFNRPYVKDIVTPMGIPSPSTVAASRYAAGKALLDYLETVGIEGVTLEVTGEEAAEISKLWAPPEEKEETTPESKPEDLDPVPDKKADGAGEEPSAEKAATEKEQDKKEEKNGQQAKN